MEDFDSWYLLEHARVFGVCVALSGDLDAAGEATDEAFTRALERWGKVSVMAAPGACELNPQRGATSTELTR